MGRVLCYRPRVMMIPPDRDVEMEARTRKHYMHCSEEWF
jgi:hypothetical protein